MKKFLAILLAALLVIPAVLVFSASADEVLVSKGKSYAISGSGTGYINLAGQWPSKYDANLTDGSIANASADVKFGAESNQFAFYYSANADASLINAPEGIGTATIDLGEVTENIATYKAHVHTPGNNGIDCPDYIKVSVSSDNKTFTEIGEFTGLKDSTADPYWVSLTTEKGVSARYVRFTFAFKAGTKAVFLFLDELEVYTDASKESGDTQKTYRDNQTTDEQGNMVFDNAIDYTFRVDKVNGSVAGEDSTISTSKEAFEKCNPKWAITIFLKKLADNKYEALESVFGGGNIPEFAWTEDTIALTIHSATSDPKQADKYPNWEQKVAAVAVKAGDVIVLNNVDLTKDGPCTDATAHVEIPGGSTPTPVKETITVDGELNDNGWKADGWKEVTPETGRWQGEPQTEDTLSYRYQLRADDEYLYVAVEAACKSVDGGNGNGTNLRFWINSDPEATIYTHFYDVFTQDGETKVLAKRNNSKTENKGANIENSTIEAKYVGGEQKVVIEFKVKLSEFNGGESFKYFICVSNKVNENICLYNAQLPITDADRLANFPYKLWNKETETSVTTADIKLGEIGGDPQPPVDDDPDKKYIEEIIASVGEKNPDGQFDLVIEAPEEYKAGDEITVNVKIKNIKVEEGIVSLLADFYYDNEKLTLLNTADEDGAIECITLPDSWENLVKQDKDEQHNVIDNGHITLAVLTGKKKPVKDDDSLTFTFKFKAKEGAKNAIGFYIPHESVTAKKYDLTDALGNGGYAITKMHVEGEASSSSSKTTQTGDGSTSMIVFAIVALVAICGSAVVIKSRK